MKGETFKVGDRVSDNGGRIGVIASIDERFAGAIFFEGYNERGCPGDSGYFSMTKNRKCPGLNLLPDQSPLTTQEKKKMREVGKRIADARDHVARLHASWR